MFDINTAVFFYAALCVLFAGFCLFVNFGDLDKVSRVIDFAADRLLELMPGRLGREARMRREAKEAVLNAMEQLTADCVAFHDGWFVRVMNNDADEADFSNEDIRRDWGTFSAVLSDDINALSEAFERASRAQPGLELDACVAWAEKAADKICRGDALVCRRFGLM